MTYEKITEFDVYSKMRGIEIDPMSCGYGMSVPQLASLLKTSKYQVRKHIKTLFDKGVIEKHVICDTCTCHSYYCECGATGLTWKNWIFKNDLEEYKDHDIEQSEQFDKAWRAFAEGSNDS